jgi:hypothetical protein
LVLRIVTYGIFDWTKIGESFRKNPESFVHDFDKLLNGKNRRFFAQKKFF